MSFTITASDLDIPAQNLVFSLESGAPSGASINSTSGRFTWTATATQTPSTNALAVRVTDDGSPSLSDTKAFTIEVRAAKELRILSVKRPVNGQVALRWTAEPGGVYEVIRKDRLSDPNWTSLGQVTSTGDTAIFTDALGSAKQGYYQIIRVR